ncbi:hypothetical protein O181_080551 [Austropuccinia psidii MF-1]|uniref:Uncharacterized protein n=1 Tax=Austropuccinia psidii MF-1 TaxID=1389203 RepID=A0A9Q3IF22_9BASI|nr:hypothetical protein [Austropuccinia psidii MF-1]
MDSSGHFDPSPTYDGYKEVEFLDPAFDECLKKSKQCYQPYSPQSSKFHHYFVGEKPCQNPGAPSFQHLGIWVGGPIPVGASPIYCSSEVPISRINIQGVVKRLRKISTSPTDLSAEGSDELDCEEVEVVPNSISHQSSTSPSQPDSRRFQSQIIPSTPRNLQQVLSTIPYSFPPPSPNASIAWPAVISPVRPSPIPQPRNSPIVTSHQLQPVTSARRRRED